MDANKSSISYREQPALVDESIRAHNHSGMDDRTARMEVNIAYIRRDVDELRVGFRRMSDDIRSLKDAIFAESSKRKDQFTQLRGEIGDFRMELRGEIGDLRMELRGEIGALRTELRGEIGALGTELRGEIGDLRHEIGGLRHEMGDVRLAVTAMDSRLERKLEQHFLKFQSRMLWTIGAAVGPIVLAWFIQTFLPALRASSGG
ncbi:MAG TPA: hypothetical protein VK519_11955 [Pinirhizobacter sp.]|uniref:hypothetical protein n=1 Tax=Pinirhizobacter sp. TaxID=2950432 RepID=UPI002B71E181|nr:hypothetical protein [Pinirhizobacter sp.]HMH68618.1 hypothetical protein [Pinirhizobacter sp.]